MNLPKLQALYPYQKPQFSFQLVALALIASFGLIALFIAAYHAFLLVANPWQAFFAALVIEAGLIVEALALINKPKTVYPWLGLIISYVVSGTYNFTQAAQMGQGLGNWELSALAFGPLSALAVVSLTFGNELRSYQERVKEWESNQAEWVRAEYQRIEQARIASELEQEQRRLEAEQKRLESEQRHAEKMARIEAKKDAKLPRNKTAKKRIPKIEKRQISLNIIRENPEISGAELGRQLQASERTGQTIINEFESAGLIVKNGNGWKVKEG